MNRPWWRRRRFFLLLIVLTAVEYYLQPRFRGLRWFNNLEGNGDAHAEWDTEDRIYVIAGITIKDPFS